jgi:hypothetical protein
MQLWRTFFRQYVTNSSATKNYIMEFDETWISFFVGRNKISVHVLCVAKHVSSWKALK